MFHVTRPEECAENGPGGGAEARAGAGGKARLDLDPFEAGFLIGVLVGEGHFGGDGRQPQVTLRMHTRHVDLFRWLMDRVGGRLYGPYDHGGRHYYQWMARGPFLRDALVPLLDRCLRPDRDAHAWERYLAMKRDYGIS